MREQGDAAESGFVDVATSLLAVILLATMMALAAGTVSSVSTTAQEPGDGLLLRDPSREMLPPFSSYHVVAGGRIADLSLGSVGEAIAAEPSASSGQVDFGRWNLIALRNVIRDVDSYELRLRLSPDWLSKAPSLDPDVIADRWVSEAREHRRVPLVFVRPSGMENFVALHAILLERGVRFRWLPVEEDGELRLFRTFDMFLQYSFRR